MLWLLLLVVVAAVGYFVWKNNKNTAVAQKVAHVVEKVADVNKDGKVDFKDAVAAAQNVKKEVVKDVAIVKEEVKKVKKKYGGKVKKTPPKP